MLPYLIQGVTPDVTNLPQTVPPDDRVVKTESNNSHTSVCVRLMQTDPSSVNKVVPRTCPSCGLGPCRHPENNGIATTIEKQAIPSSDQAVLPAGMAKTDVLLKDIPPNVTVYVTIPTMFHDNNRRLWLYGNNVIGTSLTDVYPIAVSRKDDGYYVTISDVPIAERRWSIGVRTKNTIPVTKLIV